ncbi:MAG: hypothetical protein ACTSR8_18180 [Promethearchaeota archaeon]
MEDYLRTLKLDRDIIEIYLKILGENPLSFNEIREFNKKISIERFNKIIDNLLERKLLIKEEPNNPKGIIHYSAIPPIDVITKKISQVNKYLSGVGGNFQIAFQEAVQRVFKEENKLEISSLLDKITAAEKDFDKEAQILREELTGMVEGIQTQSISVDFLNKYEEEIKNIINSEIAGILIPLLQFKSEFREKYEAIGITDSQWDSIKDSIKDLLAGHIHEKANELNDIINQEFQELRQKFEEVIANRIKFQFEQKSVYLGIINIFKNELIKVRKIISEKDDNIKSNLRDLAKLTNQVLIKTYEELIQTYSGNIDSVEKLLKTILKQYENKEKQILNNLTPINSEPKINEVIFHLISKSTKEILIIVPKIEGFVPINKIQMFSKKYPIRLISSEAHNNSIIKDLKKNNNIEYKRLKNNNFITILADKSYLVFGFYEKETKDPLNNIFGFSTDYKPIIDFLIPLIDEKWLIARYEDMEQIKFDLNRIIDNINDFSGWKIGEILHDVIDIVESMGGMSLNVLEIKLLRNKLRSVNDLLNDTLKNEIIEKIKDFNQETTKVDLQEADIHLPKDTRPKIDVDNKQDEENFIDSDFLESEMAISQQMKVQKPVVTINKLQEIREEPKLETFPEAVNKKSSSIKDQTNDFKFILENIDSIDGAEISKKLQDILDDILETHGYSMTLGSLKKWISKLKKVKKPLGGEVKAQFMDDFKKIAQKYAPNLINTEKENEDVPSFLAIESNEYKDIESSSDESAGIKKMFDDLIKKVNELKGPILSIRLQDIADILLESHGAVAIRDLRSWIHNLRAIKEKLDAVKAMELISNLQLWQEKYC